MLLSFLCVCVCLFVVICLYVFGCVVRDLVCDVFGLVVCFVVVFVCVFLRLC